MTDKTERSATPLFDNLKNELVGYQKEREYDFSDCWEKSDQEELDAAKNASTIEEIYEAMLMGMDLMEVADMVTWSIRNLKRGDYNIGPENEVAELLKAIHTHKLPD